MTTSDKAMEAVILQIKTHPTDFDRNIDRLCAAIAQTDAGSLVVAPEVCITGYPYDRLEEAARAGDRALERVSEIGRNRTIVFSVIQKERGRFYNRAYVLHDGGVIHAQNKVKLFTLGEEDRYLTAGSMDEFRLFTINGRRFGLLICFELRYPEIWLKLRGADAILVPARWGLPRKRHLEVLARGLAVSNQCYTLVANSADEDMASGSGIATPGGDICMDDLSDTISRTLDFRQVDLIRRHIRMGVF